MTGQPLDTHATSLPKAVSAWAWAAVIAVVIATVVILAWRGPAILVDLSALAGIICF